MASDEERELAALLSDLRATEAPPHDDAAERMRRTVVSRAIERRARTHGAGSEPRNVRRGRLAAFAPGAVAAALLFVVSAAYLVRGTETPSVEPEPVAGAKRPRATEAPAPAASNDLAPPPVPSTRQKELRPSRRHALPPVPHQASSTLSPATSGASLAPAASAEASGASLGAQNELFQSAVRAARRGDDEGALREFELLLERFPTSPLAADSSVRRFRTLARLGRTAESASAAREYLARYPEGFAAAEAEKLLSTAASDGTRSR